METQLTRLIPYKPSDDLMARTGDSVLGLADATRTALSLPHDLSIDAWSSIGARLLALSDSSAWWIGDWLVFGEEEYKDRYRRAMRDTNLHYQTLKNYAWIARKFQPARRRARLTFQHHVEVAAFTPPVQDHWLDLAENFHWSRNELRKQIRDSEALGEIADDEVSELQLRFSLPRERIDRWVDAARRSNHNLVDWIASILDSAIQPAD